ncbi:ribosomal protein S18-alanine N-acetyltransferase [Paenibacillus massiliensis]|uniref:ribosomal protein S18-alanine N-acetyltransferase n=1 Tax=Paenibacillus massiliensis TaxID=225917 RepID=UPI000377CDA4
MRELNEQERQEASITFRPMLVADIQAVMKIERECFTLPWTEDAFRNELTHNMFAKYLLMELDGDAIGYAGMWTILDEAHITNIAVREQYRGRRLGERLLDELMKQASQLGMERMTLEVRVSNHVAQKLYEKKGFIPSGMRKGYYSDNQEDALIMWADLPAGHNPEDQEEWTKG